MGLTKKKIYYWLKILKGDILYLIKYFYQFLTNMQGINNFDLPQGEFIDTRNGEKIVVRDNVIDGDNMMLITSKGQLSLDDFSKYYIQVSNDVYDENGRKIGTDSSQINTQTFKRGPIDFKEINKHVFDINDIDDGTNDDNTSISYDDTITSIIDPNMVGTLEIADKAQLMTTKVTLDESSLSNAMLTKLFDNISKEDLPIKVDLDNWNNFPKEQLNMLIESFGVTFDDIADYIYNNCITTDEIKEAIRQFLSNYLVNKK